MTRSLLLVSIFIFIFVVYMLFRSGSLGRGEDEEEAANNILLVEDSIEAGQNSPKLSRSHESYLLILPYEGLTNQLVGLIRGSLLAHRLGRTLLIPPLTRSQHECRECPRMESWSEHLDLLPILGDDCEYLKTDGSGHELSRLVVFSFGRWRTWKQYGQSTRHFLASLPQSNIVLRWRPFTSPLNWKVLVEYLSMRADKILVVGQLQHVHFDSDSPMLEEIYRRLYVGLKISPREHVGVHWRRGDFESACSKKNQTACWPDLTDLARRLGPFHDAPVWIASDDCEAVSGLTRMMPKVTFLASTERCSKRYFDDLRALVGSVRMIGNQYSTLSRVSCRLRAAFGQPCEYF